MTLFPHKSSLGKVELLGNREAVHLSEAHLCVSCQFLVAPGPKMICPLCESKALLPLKDRFEVYEGPLGIDRTADDLFLKERGIRP